VWIGTSSQLYVYHQDQQALYDFRDMGDLSRISHQQDLLKNFWEIYEYKQWVYIASEQGLISYDKKRGQWSMVFETAYFSGRKINAMAFSDEYCFLGTNFGFDRIDLNRFFQRDYRYPFIGQVNDLFISDDVLWLGTNKGLTKFQWTKNL
jgi:ligand-binding sensor domain-containing protein